MGLGWLPVIEIMGAVVFLGAVWVTASILTLVAWNVVKYIYIKKVGE